MEEGKVTPEEAAEILGYHIDHVYRLLRSGRMRGEKKYRVWLIDRREVERIREAQNEHGRLD
jgi:excisionase family DNA binding protein